ncbi:GHKL domain-containing protein [Pseudoalteromonas sp. S4498]|uniref:sensor histidine kinase n=1 Tax=Pseudoalteromonas galatheae TaxID=579562 RepID=UPI0011090FA4|nr:sensor histidine kinase [Pseudoalteromonas galatheae]NKC20359.1 GHKL domain-containing protein [Pseudoalteromonas galatheae]
MKEIPFKVSARAARLIGAENIANAESAVIELIKNSYDADAETCLVYFEHIFDEIPSSFTHQEFEYLSASPSFDKFSSFFKRLSDDCYKIGISSSDESLKESTSYELLVSWLTNLCRVWIVDDGHGMNEKTIENNWMTIGTNNKEKSPTTKKFIRIKSGAKGLGRFALDKLGALSSVYVYPDKEYYQLDKNNSCLEWYNWWENFLAEGKTLDSVKAQLDYGALDNLFHTKYLPEDIFDNDLGFKFKNHGVVICCDYNKENWHKERQKRLCDSLETLIPPNEKDNFSLFFVSNKYSELNKKISSAVNTNFDYKVSAQLGDDNSVVIDIDRNEFEVSEFPEEFYESERFKNLGSSIDDFKKGRQRHCLTLKNLFPKLDEFDSIGNFSLSFYFSKLGSPGKEDREKFLYKSFDLSTRKSWADTFGGIRIFRDNFRVRPYGEPGAAKDWLGLGDRAASSPAGIGNPDGGWRVRPNQISGVVSISRVNNPRLADKSSREGIQENDEFAQFKSVILKILEIFENDRAEIGAELKAIYDQKNAESQKEEQANTISKQVLEGSKNKEGNNEEEVSPEQKNLKLLASQYEKKKEQIEELREEQKILRSLATIGTISSSFSHDLKLLHGKLVKRFIPVQRTLEANHEYSINNNLDFTEDLLDSIERIKIFKNQDNSMKDWINFSLLGVKKDKRRRRKVYLDQYLKQLKKIWEKKLDDRSIDFDVDVIPKDIALKCFEIDLDCIFNNLVVNSVEAFSQKDAPSLRKINIEIHSNETDVIIIYSDSGPGLSKDIVNPQRIFQCFFTTKVNEHSGEDEGTGIGMWMVKSTINEYRGNTKLLLDKSGFGLEIQIPKNL